MDEAVCPHCGVEGIEHTPEDVARFDEDMLAILKSRLTREEFGQ